MKAFAFALSLLPLLAIASPVAEPEPEPAAELEPIEKRSVTCALTGSNVKYHRSPSAGSDAIGEFGATGTKVPFSCYTVGSGSGVPNGDTLWNKVASGKGAGYWVTDYYITRACSDEITTHC